MDYEKERLWFKIKKVLRYIRIFGLPRTVVKVRGHYHMSRRVGDFRNARFRSPMESSRVGIIGCGNYAFSNIAYYLSKYSRRLIRGVMDVDFTRAASLGYHYKACYSTDDAREIVSDENINLIFIASNHATHAEYAVECLLAGKDVHIEKPHVVTDLQLQRLVEAMRQRPNCKVFLGFNRPRSKLFRLLQRKLSEQTGPLMINWFIAGHEIADDHWYFDKTEGGRVLGNLCHWTDLTLHMVGLSRAFPCSVYSLSPSGAKSDFVFSVLFAEGSCASITFSAKGHTFEGVREVLNVHKGNLIGNISDFQRLSIEVLDKKINERLWFRDHGHQVNIINSLTSGVGEDPRYVYLTAKFFLACKEALERGRPVVVTDDWG